ncbi:BlaR1 family beta-lactam sensor/signal transducer [Peribacillus loiseleuriae]|uniref:BlaR1 family beta-lactam sensor/signal transducer n=1 Tax=Peribacillus loiseleuriae TaxID=1679170 RepID=UPI00383007B1
MGNSFFTLFLISNIILSVIFCIIIFIKKLLKAQITVNTQYHISVISLLTLIAPFIPFHFLKINSFFDWMINFGASNSKLSDIRSAGKTTEIINQNANWLQDFSMSIEQSSFGMMDSVFFIVWILGLIVILMATLYSNLRIIKIKKSLQVVENKELSTLFYTCKEELHFHKMVVLGYSSLIKSPITFGIIYPYIVMPKDISTLSTNEMKCVFLHELYHCKRRDMLVNYFMCLSRTVYWFNPLVWYFLKEMKTEMEISCDYAVLKTLDKESHLKYSEVILKFASLSQRTSSLLAASEISSSYKQVKRRIVTIVNFQVESHLLKMKSALVFIIVLAIILISIPSISILAVNKESHPFSNTNVVYKDYSSFFDELSGSAVLYDLKMKQYTIYNKEESTTRFAPASTYKIFNALFALESGIITRDNSQMTWDGTLYPYEEWNQDQDLFSAMESSASWYFQNLDQQMGKKKLQNYYEQINYGNGDLSGNITNYWLNGSLKISPVEQVDILKKFYDNEFAFEQSNIQTVKDSLLLEESNGNRLSGKTGTSVLNGENITGWFVGYVETVDNTFFFAAHSQGEKQAGGRSLSKIVLSILEKEGIYQSIFS